MTEYFPELNNRFLKLFGKRWAQRYERVPIELILLAKHNDIRFSKDYLEDEFMRRKGFESVQIKEAKYDIFFVVSYDKVLFDEAKIGYPGRDVSEYHLQLIRGDKKPGALQDFLNNIEYGQTTTQAQCVRLLTDGFHDDVYREPPDSMLWRHDWDIHAILQNYKNDFSLPSEMVREPYLVLYANDRWGSLERQQKDVTVSRDKTLKWINISITFLNDNEIHIQYGKDNVSRDYGWAGFGDLRGGGSINSPIDAWYTLLESSKKEGVIPWSFETRKKVEKHVQTLRKKFRALFPGINPETDPLPLDKKKRQYKTAFHLKTPLE